MPTEHLSLLADTSARTALTRRDKVAGFDPDMLRSFESRGRAMAAYTSSINNSRLISQHLRDMGQEARWGKLGTDEERMDFYNELVKRHMMEMDYQATPKALSRALAVSSVYNLISSPSYLLVNAT